MGGIHDANVFRMKKEEIRDRIHAMINYFESLKGQKYVDKELIIKQLKILHDRI